MFYFSESSDYTCVIYFFFDRKNNDSVVTDLSFCGAREVGLLNNARVRKLWCVYNVYGFSLIGRIASLHKRVRVGRLVFEFNWTSGEIKRSATHYWKDKIYVQRKMDKSFRS